MKNTNEEPDIITEVGRILAVGYLRMRAMKSRSQETSPEENPQYIKEETSQNDLDIPGMSSNPVDCRG